jgi:hypothetical protein
MGRHNIGKAGEKSLAMSYRLNLERIEELKTMAAFNNKSVAQFLRGLIQKEWAECKVIIMTKKATASALRQIKVDEKIIKIIDKPEDVMSVMSEEKYREFYKIYKSKKLELINEGIK